LIDIDEAALFVELANRSRGKCSIVRQVRDIGPYGHSEKLNILVAITTRDDAAPGQSAHRWVDTWRDGGTTIVRWSK
jgi:phage baseplate assembly protein gpV